MELLSLGAFGSARFVRTKEGEFVEKVQKALDLEGSERELRVLLEASHPHLIRHQCHYFEETPDGAKRLVIRTEFCSQGTLDKLIHESGFVYSISTLIEWASHLYSVLAYLVEISIVHRDIKPTNVFIDKDFRLKLGDFGLSLESIREKMDTPNAGIAAYSSPEANGYGTEDGQARITTASDVYGVGVVLWELVERKRIFRELRRTVNGFGIRGSLQRGELTVPSVSANQSITDLIKRSTMIDRHLRPSPANLFHEATKMKKWDLYRKYPIIPSTIGELNTTERPLGINDEPMMIENDSNEDYETCQSVTKTKMQRGCSRSFAFKNKEKPRWRERNLTTTSIPTENEYEVARKKEEEIRWRRQPPSTSASPSEEERGEGEYEVIDEFQPLSSKDQSADEHGSKHWINLSLISNPSSSSSSSELNGESEDWLISLERRNSMPKYCIGIPGCYDNLMVAEVDPTVYEDFIRISNAAWTKQRSTYSYKVMQMMVSNMDKKQRLPLIRKLCLTQYYSRAAWCIFYCIEKYSLIDVNWLGMADCLFRIIIKELIEQNIATGTGKEIESKVTRYIRILYRAEQITKNEEVQQIWKVVRFLLSFDMALFGSEDELIFREINLNVLKKSLHDGRTEKKKRIPRELISALENDIQKMQSEGPSLEERSFCVTLWSNPQFNAYRPS